MNEPRAPRGMTLIEIMVASVIALIVTASAMSLAGGLMRATRNTQAQAEVSAKQAMTHGFIERSIDSVGFLWDVTQMTGTGHTGAWGAAYCVPGTGLCESGKEIFPLRICSSNNLNAADDCDAPSVSWPDGLKAILPRDEVVEMVTIKGEGGSPLPTTCGALGSPANFDVEGITSTGWSANDLLLIVKRNHVTVARLASNFAADTTDPPVSRSMSIDIGTNTDLENDDGGRTTGGCDASDRLSNARVFRIKQVMFRVSNEELQLAQVLKSTQAAAPTWIPLVEGIDDLQFRLDLMAVPGSGTAFTCQCEVSDILDGSGFTGGDCPTCSGGERLNSNDAVDDVYRIIGLQIGLMLHAGPELDPTGASSRSYSGLFDRSSQQLANDSRLRRRATYYVGLRNAAVF